MLTKIRKIISEKVKQARKERRYTQLEIAKLLSLSQSRYSEIENEFGSFTAEQLVLLIKHFNLPLSYFVGNVLAGDVSSQLQNALSRLGARGLQEDPRILPSENIAEVNKVILETIVSADSARQITALAPVIANNYDRIDIAALSGSLSACSRTQRLGWILESTVEALQMELEKCPLRRDDKLLYLRAIPFLKQYLEAIPPVAFLEDFLDKNITTAKTVTRLKTSRSELAKRWKILTRITTDDFVKALKESRT